MSLLYNNKLMGIVGAFKVVHLGFIRIGSWTAPTEAEAGPSPIHTKRGPRLESIGSNRLGQTNP